MRSIARELAGWFLGSNHIDPVTIFGVMARKTIDFDVVREIARTLSGVEESSIHGAPSLKVRGKLLACPALHSSAESDTMVLKLSFDKRYRLIADAPQTYYLTDHYVNDPIVLVRLSRIDR